MGYSLLKEIKLVSEDYELVSIREEDVYLIKTWRNEQMDILRQKKPLSDEDQKRYFLEKIFPTFSHFQPEQILLSYLKDGKCIGYGGIVHIDWESKRGEVSFLLETSRVSNHAEHSREFAIFLKLLKKLAFECLDFHRLTTETFDIRPWHVAVMESEDFVLEGCLRNHVIIQGKYTNSLLHGILRSEYVKIYKK